jgi:F-type H+-transporting ATPase subunit epsilon
LDEAAALQAKQRAEEALRDAKDKQDVARAQAELIQAAEQYKLIQKLKGRSS